MVYRMIAAPSLKLFGNDPGRGHCRTFLLIGFIAIVTAVAAQEENTGPSLPQVTARFDESLALVNQPITALNQSYEDALQRLMAAEKDKGNLDGALQVQEEIERFGDGSAFDSAAFAPKPTDHPSLAAMKAKYLSERARLWNAGKRSRDELLKNYLAWLGQKEKDLTRLGKLEEAVEIRQLGEALGEDPRLVEDRASSRPKNSFPAKIRFVAKGDVELRHNGARLQYRNSAPDRDKYIDGTSTDFNVTVGDVILVRMRSTVVFRSLIMTIESNDGSTAIPVTLNDFRYLGLDVGSSPEIGSILKVTAKPDRGAADADMATMWAEMSITDLSRAGSEWIKCGPGTNWHTYAILIQGEMLLSVPTD